MSTAAVVVCPNCGQESPLEEVHRTDSCGHCGADIPDDAPTKFPASEIGENWEELLAEDYEPMGGVDYQADEVTEPDRDIEGLDEVLASVETGDVLTATIGMKEEQATEKFYVISHGRDIGGLDHRITFVQSPEENGWTRAYIAFTGAQEFDPWEVVSAPYDLGGDGTLDLRDYASNGWMIKVEKPNE